MTIKDFILRAMEHDPLTEAAAQKILKRILQLLGYNAPKELLEPQKQDP
jgi:hypothetical protein